MTWRVSPLAVVIAALGTANSGHATRLRDQRALGIHLSAPPRPIAITHVTVIDVNTGARASDRTVLTRGNRIVSVTSASDARLPRDATIVDGKGRFVIPGLWDMHVHAAWPVTADRFKPLFIANGVTGVREMFGSRVVINAWRDSLKTGTSIAPRIVASGHIVDGRPSIWAGSATAMTANEGRQAVDSLIADGAEFIKVYAVLPREAYFAIADEAKRRGVPFAGHVSAFISPAEASDAGQRSIEHLSEIIYACSTREAELRAFRDSLFRNRPSDSTNGARYLSTSATIAVDSHDAARCDDLYRRFARNGTWQVPTLTVLRGQTSPDDSSLWDDKRLKYLDPSLAESWKWQRTPRLRSLTAADWAARHRLFDLFLKITGEMHRDSVPILAGTDVFNPYCLPGFGLHDELQLLVRAGLTNIAALQAATIGPAKFLNATDSLGTVATGKVADLVVLDADPLSDIANTTKIRAVVANGRLLDRKALDSMLAAAARLPVSQPIIEAAERGGSAAAIAKYRSLKATSLRKWRFDELQLDDVGYWFLDHHRVPEAIAVFQLNGQEYPKSPNVFDSLGQAYLTSGDTTRAIINYKRVLTLAPNDAHATTVLRRLGINP